MSLFAVIGLRYPVGKSLALVLERCGMSKLSKDELKTLVTKRVEPGEACDDVPVESKAALLRQGRIKEVEAVVKKAAKAAKKGVK